MRNLFLLLLTGCLGPTGSNLCVENAQTSAEACEQELDSDAIAQRQNDCDYIEGYTQSAGCAEDYKKLADCVSNAIAGKSCEKITEAINSECAYLQGRVSGCLPPNNPAQ